MRDGNAWANYIAETVALWGPEVEVAFQSHNWPHWGNAQVNDYLVNSAAAYKYINNQTLTYIQAGLTSTEIAHQIRLPMPLQKNWYTRQYYGTVAHNSKAVYQRFMGWYDANPIHLDELTPTDRARKLVEYLADVDVKINVHLTDLDQHVLVRVKNGPLLHFDGIQAEDPVITLAGPKLAMLLLISHDVERAKAALSFSGDEDLLVRIMDAMQPPTGISPFNIIEP